MSRIQRRNMKDSSFFHIMVQGINKEYIFDGKKGAERYLKLIYENKEGIQIIAYCIMQNHVHILIQADSIENIGSWMRKANTSYAMYYNKKSNRVGYVFRDRYKVQPIKDAKHLYACIEYIHNNPVKANICKTKKEYKYSSYLQIYHQNENEIYETILKLLKQNDIKEIISKHNNKELDNFEFIEDEENSKKQKSEEICKKIISEFLQSKQIQLKDLKKQKGYLSEIVRRLKYDNNISYRIMEKQLNISRETLRNLEIKM